MNNIILLSSTIIRIIVIIVLIIFISKLFLSKSIENFTDNPTLNKCIIYKTNIDDALMPFVEEYLKSEKDVKNATAAVEQANAASTADPNYNANLEAANNTLKTAIYNRYCKAFGMDAINNVNTKLNNLLALDSRLNVEQRSKLECNYLNSEIMSSLEETSNKINQLTRMVNYLEEEWSNKFRELNILSSSSPNYSKVLKETKDAENAYRIQNEYKKCYSVNAGNVLTTVSNVVSALYETISYDEDEPGVGNASADGAGNPTADQLRQSGNISGANILNLRNAYPELKN
jgi:hypothetical protein